MYFFVALINLEGRIDENISPAVYSEYILFSFCNSYFLWGHLSRLSLYTFPCFSLFSLTYSSLCFFYIQSLINSITQFPVFCNYSLNLFQSNSSLFCASSCILHLDLFIIFFFISLFFSYCFDMLSLSFFITTSCSGCVLGRRGERSGEEGGRRGGGQFECDIMELYQISACWNPLYHPFNLTGAFRNWQRVPEYSARLFWMAKHKWSTEDLCKHKISLAPTHQELLNYSVIKKKVK